MIFNTAIPVGGGGFVVAFTTQNNGTSYTADKTFGEIAAALDAGVLPVIKFEDSTYVSITRFASGNSTYFMKLSDFHTRQIQGGQSDYPSWTSDNN